MDDEDYGSSGGGRYYEYGSGGGGGRRGYRYDDQEGSGGNYPYTGTRVTRKLALYTIYTDVVKRM